MNKLPRYEERELKLRCTDATTWDQIMTAQSLLSKAVPESEDRKVLETHYFDTESACLQKAKLAYRIRREGEQWIATVKGGGSSRGGLHERHEWNVLVSNPQPDITVFAGTAMGKKIMTVVGSEKLYPVLMTRFERSRMDVIMPDGSQIEVAADQGEIIAGVNLEPILEVELELKKGEVAALFQLGAELAREFSLVPEVDSKYYRGLKLAGKGTLQREETYQPPQVDKTKLASEELSKLLLQLIGRFLVTQQNFIEKPDLPENIHEMRIALRRLRSLLEFSGTLVTKQHKFYLTELKNIGKLLGNLREIDVAYGSWRQVKGEQTLTKTSKMSLGECLCQARMLEAEKVHKIIRAGHTTSLLLELQAILADNKGLLARDVSTNMNEYAISKLSSSLKALTKQGKKIDWMTTEDMHKIRLQVKKIKYVAEVLETAFIEIPQLVLRLDTLQNNLGFINDVDSTESILETLLKGNSNKALYLEAGLVIGWQGREALFVKNKMDKYWQNFYRTAQRWLV